MPIEGVYELSSLSACSGCNLVRTWNQNFVFEYPFMYWNIRYQCYTNSSHFNSGVLSFYRFQDSGCVCSRATMNQGAPDDIFLYSDEYDSAYAWEVRNSLWFAVGSTNPFLSEHLRTDGKKVMGSSWPPSFIVRARWVLLEMQSELRILTTMSERSKNSN